jgi:hypothetical protein
MRHAAMMIVLMLVAGVWLEPRLTGAAENADTNAAAAGAASELPCQMPVEFAAAATATVTPALVVFEKTAPYKQVTGNFGYWRLAQTHDNVWWFLSPDGKTEFLNTVTTVQPFQAARDKDGPAFLSSDYDGGMASGGNLDAWAQRTIVRVTDAGFKGLGAWSHPVFHKTSVPMTRDLNLWMWMHGAARRFYSPEFAVTAEEAIRSQAAPLKDNRSLVGYFIDNELDWSDASVGPAAYFDELAATDPNRVQVVHVIRKLWTTLDQFNHDWKVGLKAWTDIDRWNALPKQPQQAYSKLFSGWLSHLATDYFRLTTTTIRKYDANHLILGVRYKGWALREVVAASRGFTDVQSLNYYPSDAQLDAEMFRMMHEVSGQPVMISEYSFHALDGRSGNRNTVGFTAQVLDQQARADGYRLMTTRLARVPYVVGADWFQWNDEPPSGRANDGEDANFGVVDIDDKPYQTMVDAVRETTPQLNGLHAASHKDAGKDVWRESFAVKPVAHVPYLTTTVRLNGELSDWPAQAKLQGVRHSATLGLERSKLPLPNVYLGWREEGVYLGAEVFDHDIVGAPASGAWWTRDNFEFWLSTKPVGADQDAYDANAHEFFFVPNSFPGDDGLAGTVGQWRRDGDGLTDNLIPHPAVKQVTRIFNDRYVVEIFIPAKALRGYDPKKQRSLAFNIHFRNHQHALDYFWSAPKDVLTQLRPNTWGPIYLQGPAGAEVKIAAKPVAPPTTQRTASLD